MVRVAVTGIGVVSPIGVGDTAFFDALAAGASGLRPDDRAGSSTIRTARVGDFGARDLIAPAQIRRMPRLSQMIIVAAKQALAAAALPYDASRIGAVLGTGLGTLNETLAFMDGYLKGGPENASPLLFPSSVMNAAAGQLSLECRLKGPNSTVNHKDASSLQAIGLGCDLLELGRADAILVGGMDELSTSAFEFFRRFLNVETRALRPYDSARDGVELGEGAALILLEREEDARARGATIRAIVAGRGERSGSRPRVGWGHERFSPDAISSARGESDVDCVCGAGNGTAYDQRELDALSEAFPRCPPVSSILGQVGESHSSTMMRVLAGIFALERQTILGTVGLSHPIARYADVLVGSSRAARVRSVLVPTFSQGGSDVAVRLERA